MTRPASHWQRGLQHFNGVLFLPSSGTDGAGKGLGTAWTTDTAAVGITIAHATPGTAIDTQMKRTTYTNVAGTADQELGPRLSAATDKQFWFGNAAGLGGFYFSAIFRVETWNSDGGRLFVGLSNSANPVCISDTVPNHTIGLWHDSTDGANVLSIVTKAATGTTKDAITGATLAAGQAFLWEMWAFPFGISVINTQCRLTSINTGQKIQFNSIGGGPTTATMLAPQCQMSNGADTTVSHYSISVANIYCAPYSQTLDGTG